MVRAQRLVEGRAGAPSEPQGTPDGRPPHQHGHLPGAPLARRRTAARADPAHPLRAVLRALRLCRRHRGPRAALRPPVTVGVRGRPALGGPADRRAAQRVLPQRPDARAGAASSAPRSPSPRAPPSSSRCSAGWCPPRPAEPGAPPRADAPVLAALRARAGSAGVHHRDVPPVGRPVRRRTAPQGRGGPAPRGHRPVAGAAARGHRQAAVPGARPSSPSWPAG